MTRPPCGCLSIWRGPLGCHIGLAGWTLSRFLPHVRPQVIQVVPLLWEPAMTETAGVGNKMTTSRCPDDFPRVPATSLPSVTKSAAASAL